MMVSDWWSINCVDDLHVASSGVWLHVVSIEHSESSTKFGRSSMLGGPLLPPQAPSTPNPNIAMLSLCIRRSSHRRAAPVHLSIQANTSSCQSLLFCGFSTQ